MMDADRLASILAAHREWRMSGGTEGTRAYLTGADLAGADLAGANLTGAVGIIVTGPVGSEGRMVCAVDHGAQVMVQAGCWWGTLDDLEARIKPGGSHGWTRGDSAKWRAEYEAVIAYFRATAKAKGWGA